MAAHDDDDDATRMDFALMFRFAFSLQCEGGRVLQIFGEFTFKVLREKRKLYIAGGAGGAAGSSSLNGMLVCNCDSELFPRRRRSEWGDEDERGIVLPLLLLRLKLTLPICISDLQ